MNVAYISVQLKKTKNKHLSLFLTYVFAYGMCW